MRGRVSRALGTVAVLTVVTACAMPYGESQAAGGLLAASPVAVVSPPSPSESTVPDVSAGRPATNAPRAGEVDPLAEGVDTFHAWLDARVDGYPEGDDGQVTLVAEDGGLLVSVFADFLEARPKGPPVPADSGEGRRIVYSLSEQRVWLVESDGTITDTYLVSGRRGWPRPGSYQVYSKSELAYAGHDGLTMAHMVRFTIGNSLPIGFHAIPTYPSGRAIQTEEELGQFRSLGCVRQSPAHAAQLFEWAPIGTPVVVLG